MRIKRAAGAVAAVWALGLTVAGCGPLLTAGIVAGIGSATGGSSGSGAPNAETSVTAAAAQGDTNGGTVEIEFSVQDAEADPTTVEVRYSTDPNASASTLFANVATGQFTTAGAPVSNPLTTSVSGVTHRFLWNTALDLGTTLNQGSVRVQLVIGGELAFTTSFFSVDNTATPMLGLANLPSLPSGATIYADAQGASAIPIAITLLDADSQATRVDVTYSVDGGVTFPTTNVAAGTFTDTTGSIVDPTALATSAAGISYTFAWSSSLNGLTTGAATIVLRFTPQDTKLGDPRDTPVFTVNNASFSVLIDTPGPSARTDRVEVGCVLIDVAAGSLDLSLDYSINGPAGPFNPCTLAQQPPNEGTTALSAPISPGQEHTLLWNSFADFRASGVFTVTNVVLRMTPRRRSTQVTGSPVFTTGFPVDQRLIRTVFGEGLDFNPNTQATSVELPAMVSLAATPGFLEMGAGGFAFLGEVSLAGGTLSQVEVDGGFSDVHRVGLDSGNNRFVLDRAFSFGQSQRITLRRIDRTTGISTDLLVVDGVPFAAAGNAGDNASLAVVGTRVVASFQTSGLGQVLRSVGTLGGSVQNLSFGGVVIPGVAPVPVNAAAEVSALVGDTTVVGTVVAGLRGSQPGDPVGVYGTTDSGVTWNQLLAQPITDLDADFPNNLVIAGSPGSGVWVSVNSGATWVLGSAGLPAAPQISAVAIQNTTTFFAAISGRVFTSVDAGVNWAPVGGGSFPATAEVRDLLLEPAGIAPGTAPFTLYAATNQGVYGLTTGLVWNQIPGIPNSDVRGVDLDPAGGAVFAATGAGVVVYDYVPAGWSSLNVGLTSVDVLAIAADPTSIGNLFAGTRDAGVFQSTDGGLNWQLAAAGLSDPAATAFAFDQSRLFTGTANSGVFELIGTAFTTRPTGILTTARLRINQLTDGPFPDTYVYGDAAGSQIVALNLGLVSRTIGAVVVPPNRAVRIAGTGANPGISSASGGAALATAFFFPNGVASDSATGDVFFSESAAHRVWRIDAAGIATVVAGVAAEGFSGDGGAATSARLNGPGALAFSGTSLYVSDTGNSRVRRIQAGVITTVAGAEPLVGDGQVAPAAVLSLPSAVLTTPAGILIADSINNRVRLVDPATGQISTFAGQGASGSLGDGGLATAAEVGGPLGLAIEADGSILIAQRSGRIRRVRPTGIIETAVGNDTPGNGVAGNGEGGALLLTSMSDGFEGPAGLSLQGNVLLISDTAHSKVWAANLGAAPVTVGTVNVPVGEVRRVAGDPQGANPTPALARTFDELVDVVFLPSGDFVVSERAPTNVSGGTVSLISDATGASTVLAGQTLLPLSLILRQPSGLSAISETLILIAENGRHVVKALNLGAAAVTVNNVLVNPNSIEVIAGILGNSGFSGDGAAAIQGRLSLSDSTNLEFPSTVGLHVDATGRLFIPDALNNRVRAIDAAGIMNTIAGGGRLDGDGSGAGVATLSQPLAVTSIAGTGGYAVFDGGRVRTVALSTTRVTTVAGTGAQVRLIPGSLPPRVRALALTGFDFVPDQIFPDDDLFNGTGQPGSSPTLIIGLGATAFEGAYPGMVVEEQVAGVVERTCVVVQIFPNMLNQIAVTRTEDGATWDGRAYQVNDAFDLLGPRGLSSAVVAGTTLLAIADTRNHAVYLANLGSVAFVASGYPSEPGGVITIGPNQIARIAGTGAYQGMSGPVEAAPEAVLFGYPTGITILPSGVLVVADTLYAGNGRIVALNLTSTAASVGGIAVPAAGVANLVAPGAARRPFSIAIRGSDLAWSEHGLASSSLGIPPRVRYQSQAGGTNFGLSTPAGVAVTVLGGSAPVVNGVALNAPRGVAWDSAGTLFVVDVGEDAVLGLDPTGTPFVLAGNPGLLAITGDSVGGSDGSGEPGTSALLRGVYGISADENNGALLILDTFNFSLRRVRRFP